MVQGDNEWLGPFKNVFVYSFYQFMFRNIVLHLYAMFQMTKPYCGAI